jgi:hypothetical protein
VPAHVPRQHPAPEIIAVAGGSAGDDPDLLAAIEIFDRLGGERRRDRQCGNDGEQCESHRVPLPELERLALQ